MEIDEKVRDIVFRFKEIMDSREPILRCFYRHETQVEGWLKGELLLFLDREEKKGNLANFDREVSISGTRKKVDLNVDLPVDSDRIKVWVELKHWHIGYQKNYKYNPVFYFGDKSSVGIKQDIEKLNKIEESHKFLLILATKNPGVKDWFSGLDRFNEKFRPFQLENLTSPLEFPDYYFLGLLKVL